MKLIKVSGASVEFENLFNSHITVEPFSKIALISASIKLEEEIIDITTANRLLKVQPRASVPAVDCLLNVGSYTLNDFAVEVNRAFNASLTVVSGGLALQDGNFQWKVEIDTDGNLVLQFKRGTSNEALEIPSTNLVKMLNNPTGVLKSDSASAEWDAFAWTDKFFINGSGEMVFKPQGNKFAFGLLNEAPESSDTELPPTDYAYAVYVDDTTYKVVGNGVETDTTITADATDIILIKLYGGNLHVCRLPSGGTLTSIHSFEWDYETSYIIGCSIYSATGEIKDITATFDPYQSAFTTTIPRTTETLASAESVSNGADWYSPAIDMTSHRHLNLYGVVDVGSANLRVAVSNTKDGTYYASSHSDLSTYTSTQPLGHIAMNVRNISAPYIKIFYNNASGSTRTLTLYSTKSNDNNQADVNQTSYQHTLSDTSRQVMLGALLGALKPIATVVKVLFAGNDALRDMMGFSEDILTYPKSITGKKTGEESLPMANTPNLVLVEMNSPLSVDSYDGAISSKRNIVGYIPSYDMSQNFEITYNSPYPAFIDINNKDTILLNRIMIRLLTANENESVPKVEVANLMFLLGK